MKVLVATDGSAVATDAVKFVRSLADYNVVDAIVATASVAPSHYAVLPWLPEWKEQENKRTEAILNQAKQTLDETCHSVELVHGSEATVPFILNQAKVSEVDLIVLGAKGHSAIGRTLLGSVSDSVASRAKCSVVVIRPSENDLAKAKSIVLGYDKSIASREAAAELMQWNLRADTKVDIVTVIQNPSAFFNEEYMAEPITVTPQQIASVSETAQRIAGLIAEHFPQTDSHTRIADHIGDAILHAAEKNKADFIVVGDTGHSMLGDLMLGSTSKYVLRHALCSVWISRHHYQLAEEANDAVTAS